ncbi:MAG: hypothetical protein PSW75_10740 [bacterium]|nr:hypothetical protein [bacterium]MDI1334784.1 hypothetical protein [Lacunisphaera sp.]
MTKPHTLLAALLLIGAAGFVRAGPTTSASLSAAWEENITHTTFEAEAYDAMLYEGNFEGQWHSQVSHDVLLNFGANAGFESCPRYHDLDRVLLGAEVGIQRKFGLGPLAPVLGADLSYTGSASRGSERSGARLLAGLKWSRRWNESWQTVVAADYMANTGRARVYHYSNHGLSLETHYDFAEHWQLTAGCKREWGEQVAYAWIGGRGASYPYAYAIWKNTTDSGTFGKNWQVYTMDAHADIAWISISPVLAGDRSLPLRYEQTSVVGRGESYKVRLLSLSFVQRF